ncbi:porin [Ferrimonas senticii]|uniref:porin n=1 Tax=Ferrimonas senticii TaxID=394566 RepID=UPI000415E813|nr:porin [Ferrimonas senticii]
MKKSILFLSVAAALTTQAQAIELHNDGVNKVTLGGHLTAQIGNVEWYQGVDKNTQLRANSPRINLNLTRDMGNGFTADATIESGYNMMNEGNSWNTRLGFIGVSHADYGRISFGKEWSTYYDAAWWTDMPVVFSSDQLGIYTGDTSGEASGMGRADQAVQYRKGFELGDFGSLKVGLQWQGETANLAERLGGSLIYQIADFKLGTSYVGGDILNADYFTAAKPAEYEDKLESWQVSAAYGQWGQGLYVAASYQLGTNTEANMRFIGDSKGFEAITAYGLECDTTVFVSYRQLESDGEMIASYQGKDDKAPNYRPGFEGNGDDQWEESFVSFGAQHQLTENVMVFAEYNLSTGEDRDGDNQYAMGVRLFL